MEKQPVRDQLGVLEEQLELISLAAGSASAGRSDFIADQALSSLSDLRQLLQEQGLRKSVSAEDFLRRITILAVREARESGYEIAVSTYGTGRISMEMVELAMGAIMASIRASMKAFRGMGLALRVKHRLFSTYSVYLEVRGGVDDIRFRLIDDSLGYRGSFRSEFETEKQFQRIRTHIARYGGWFRERTLADYGGVIEFRLPLPTGRFECVALSDGQAEVLVPASCVADVQRNVRPGELDQTDCPLFRLDAERGLLPWVPEPGAFAPHILRLGVADFQVWLACEGLRSGIKARRHEALDFVENDCWFHCFGIFVEAGSQHLRPLLEGEALMRIYIGTGARDESL